MESDNIPNPQAARNGDARAAAMVPDDEIRWTVTPMPRNEYAGPADLACLSHDQLVAYATDLRDDLRSVRTLLQESLTVICQQRRDLARATRIIAASHEQRRAARREVLGHGEATRERVS